MIRYKRLGLLICCFPIIAGCWDSVEVEERGFVTGIAIDLASEKNPSSPTSNDQKTQSSGKEQNSQSPEQEQNEKDEDEELDENNKFRLTQQLINPSNLSSEQSKGTNSNTTNLSQFISNRRYHYWHESRYD